MRRSIATVCLLAIVLTLAPTAASAHNTPLAKKKTGHIVVGSGPVGDSKTRDRHWVDISASEATQSGVMMYKPADGRRVTIDITAVEKIAFDLRRDGTPLNNWWWYHHGMRLSGIGSDGAVYMFELYTWVLIGAHYSEQTIYRNDRELSFWYSFQGPPGLHPGSVYPGAFFILP